MPDGEDLNPTRTYLPSDPSGPPAPIGTWGEFRLVAELGHGAFGRVYHAWDATLARDIALKVIRLPDSTRAAAALHEGRMLARVRHRNVVTVYGALQIGDEVGFWMELIQGRHLGEIVRATGPMSAEEATLVGISLCQALSAVHAAGLIHRDVKANNVMRESGGRIVLMDFGTGQETTLAGTAELAGTPVYMAPEVLGGYPASTASDLYSLGVLLYYVVTAEYPVAGRSVLDLVVAHRGGRRQLLADRRPDLPDGFVRVVEHALNPAASERPATAGAMMRDLAESLPGSGPWEGRLARALSAETMSASGSLGAIGPGRNEAAGTPARSGLSNLTRWSLAAIASVAVIGLCGVLMSVAFNQSLQREGGFSDDRAYDWWAYGARSLVAPSIYAAIALLVSRLGAAAVSVIARTLPGVGRVAGPIRVQTSRAWYKLGGSVGLSIAHWLIVLHLGALLIVWRWFYDLLNAMVFINMGPPALLDALRPDNGQSVSYRPILTVLLLTMIAAWYALLSRPALAASVDRLTRVAGGALMVFTLLLLEVPYRIIYQNEFRRVDLAGTRCYQVGKRELAVLLYCPDAPPRIHVVDANDSRLASTDITESIFSSPTP